MARSRRWRVGNFVIRELEVPTFGEQDWDLSPNQVRTKVRKGELGTVECLEASSLDGAWAVRFMPGSQMETLLRAYLDGGGADAPDSEWVELVLMNLLNVSAVPNGYFHQALLLLLGAYYDPSVLHGGLFNAKGRAFRRDVRKVRDAFLAWRDELDMFTASQPEDDVEQEERRLEAEDILSEE